VEKQLDLRRSNVIDGARNLKTERAPGPGGTGTERRLGKPGAPPENRAKSSAEDSLRPASVSPNPWVPGAYGPWSGRRRWICCRGCAQAPGRSLEALGFTVRRARPAWPTVFRRFWPDRIHK